MAVEKHFLDAISDILNPKKDSRALCINVSSVFSIIKDSGDITTSCIESTGEILIELLKRYKAKKSNSEEREDLMSAYQEGVECLNETCKYNIVHDIRRCALRTLMDLLPEEARYVQEKPALLPVNQFSNILRNIVLARAPIGCLLEALKEFLKFEDVSVSIWKALKVLVKDTMLRIGDTEASNMVAIISLLEKPNSDTNKMDVEGQNLFLCGKEGALLPKKGLSPIVQRIWETLMTVDLKPTTKQKLLVVLIEQLMPRMENPIFLTDYFMSCLDEGGAISLLGLQGIFNLIQKHNINYPNIYNKLYSLLAADIFSTTYKARFFYLSDIFLTSTHLPEAMVAGFVKKLARLSLMAPPGDIIMMMAFIKNLIIRHPGLKKMLRHSPGQDVKTDPYIFEEADPSKSRAIDSSLWEVQLLQHHVLPGVAASAMFISKPLSPTETDLGDLLEVTTEEIFRREFRKKPNEIPAAFERPTSLILPHGVSGLVHWDLNS